MAASTTINAPISVIRNPRMLRTIGLRYDFRSSR